MQNAAARQQGNPSRGEKPQPDCTRPRTNVGDIEIDLLQAFEQVL